MANQYDKSAGDMKFPAGSTKVETSAKLMGTVAKDNADAHNGTNEQKPFVGKAGKPSGPFGPKGREF